MSRASVLFLFLITCMAFRQVCAQPAPQLYYVTVNPEDSSDLIVWYSIINVAPEIDYYEVRVARVVDPNADPVDIVYTPIGTNVLDTFYINTNLESSSYSMGYTVCGVNDLGGGPSSITYGDFDYPPDSTIFLEAVYDSCQANITLSWNDYNKWRGAIDEYNIYRRTAPFVYNLVTTVSGATNTYVLNNVAPNQVYALFVEAVNSDRIRRSNSNKVDVSTGLTQSANAVIADYATLGPDNTIDLSFTIVGAPNQTQYNLVRSRNLTGPFIQIATFNPVDNHITFTDDISFTSGVYYYNIEGINNCNQAATLSNSANNIILEGNLSGNIITLSWNEYEDWLGGVDQYYIIRTCGRTDPIIDTMGVRLNTAYSEDLNAQINYPDPVSSLVCYQIQAVEQTNAYGTQGKSLSNRVCFSVNPDIRVPNAFIPNDADETNHSFEPVFSFLPEHYNMVIYNRLGTKIWEGSSAWDGMVNGKYVPEGVYLYYLQVYNYSSDVVELSGKVTVVYR